jgi:hypothetical protein
VAAVAVVGGGVAGRPGPSATVCAPSSKHFACRIPAAHRAVGIKNCEGCVKHDDTGTVLKVPLCLFCHSQIRRDCHGEAP